MRVYGPSELRITWRDDPEPYDPGDFDDAETWEYVDRFGVLGCVVETRRPWCPCCDHKPTWEVAASLWSIVGDADYHALIERELMAEAA